MVGLERERLHSLAYPIPYFIIVYFQCSMMLEILSLTSVSTKIIRSSDFIRPTG